MNLFFQDSHVLGNTFCCPSTDSAPKKKTCRASVPSCTMCSHRRRQTRGSTVTCSSPHTGPSDPATINGHSPTEANPKALPRSPKPFSSPQNIRTDPGSSTPTTFTIQTSSSRPQKLFQALVGDEVVRQAQLPKRLRTSGSAPPIRRRII